MTPRIYVIPAAVFAPTALSVVAGIASISITWWYLAALPFIWLGAVCSAPNLNLANDCLSYLAMLLGFVVTTFFEPLGKAILFGSACGFYMSAVEKYLRMRPAPDENGAEKQGQPRSQV